jgi:hypothetical protein
MFAFLQLIRMHVEEWDTNCNSHIPRRAQEIAGAI